jgi:hypothetical protein
MSRVTDLSLSGDYNYVRLAYLANSSIGPGQIEVAYAYLAAHNTSNPSGVVDLGQLPLLTNGNSVVRMNFVDPDNDEGKLSSLPQTATLYWYEGPFSLSSLTMGYSHVTGLGNYTPPQPLSVTPGTPPVPASWTPTFPTLTLNDGSTWDWMGEFDRGSFYLGSNPVTGGLASYNYFLQWAEAAAVNGVTHYNVVTATEPVFAGWTQASSGLTLSTDPGAARVVTSGGVTQIHVLAADANNQIKRTIYSDNTQTWSSWTNVPANANASTNRAPTATSWGQGRLDAFVIGIGDKQLWHYAEQDGNQLLGGSGWEPQGSPSGGFSEAPSATSQGFGNLFIAGADMNGVFWFKTWTSAGWSNWTYSGGSGKGAPSAVSMYPGRVDVYVRGGDNNLWQYYAANDGSGGWEMRGHWYSQAATLSSGILKGSPSAASRDSSHVDIFAGDGYHPYAAGHTDTAGHPQIMHLWYAPGGWSSWHTIGGILPSDNGTSPFSVVAAAPLDANRVRVFARGLNNALWWNAWSGN